MISVQLDWKPNAQFAGLLLADHRGWFTDAGIDLSILPWQPATDPVRDVGTRLGHVAVSEDNLAISAAAAGVDIVILGSMLRSSPLAWMVPQESGIETFADFAGKTIGVHVDGVTGLDFALRSAGLTTADANVVDVPYDKVDQLLAGSIDVCQCHGLVEPAEMRAIGVDLRVLWARDVGYQVYSQVISTSRATIEADPDAIDRFVDVLWSGWRAVFESTSDAAAVIIDHYLDESNVAIQQDILDTMRPWVFGEPNAEEMLGSIDPVRLQASIDLLVTNGVIDEPLRAENLLP